MNEASDKKTAAAPAATQARWTLEKIGVAVAIVVGVASTIASAVAILDSGEQLRLSREALSANERNAAFLLHVEKIGAYCDALDLSGGRTEFTWSFVRGSSRLDVIAAYKPIGTQIPEGGRIATVQARFREMENSTVPLRIWLDPKAVDFIERTVFGLRQEFMAKIPQKTGVAIAERIYVETAAKCIATREILMSWYRDATLWTIDSAEKAVIVKLSPRPSY